jgi:predicted transcriptional regulator
MISMDAQLINIRKNFTVVRLEEADVRHRTDHYADLKKLVLAHEPMHPDIAKWFRDKVGPGVQTTERVAFVGYLDEKPAVSAIVKRGENAKFCHLHIMEALREANLGDVFFSLMAYEVRDLAQRVHFTLPDSVWNSKGKFFQSFNFSHLCKANVQYRLFDEELECDAAFNEVWSAVTTKLPHICNSYVLTQDSLANDLLISIHPNHVEQIFSGKKRYELRRKFSTKWLGHRLNIYATEPAMQLVGQATVGRVIKSSPIEIWNRLGCEIGCTRSDFDEYTKDTDEIFAIELTDVTPFRVPVARKEIIQILKQSLMPPQSYSILKANKPWGHAVSLATLLQGAFNGYILPLISTDGSEHKPKHNRSNVVDFQLRRLFF